MTLPTPQVHLELERGALPAAGGTVRALLRIAVAFPDAEREREPLSLALVIDRSGSMSGPPLAHAKAAAAAAVSALRDGDRVRSSPTTTRSTWSSRARPSARTARRSCAPSRPSAPAAPPRCTPAGWRVAPRR